MTCKVVNYFTDENGIAYVLGDIVTITFHNGGGCGGCKITRITKTGFHFGQGSGRDKSVQFQEIKELRRQYKKIGVGIEID